MRWAVELRDRSWLHDDVFEVLRRHHAALCIHDLLADHPVELTADWTYVRFHGPQALERPYHGAYGPERLRPWAERLAELLGAGHDVYAYFNNDWFGHAVTRRRAPAAQSGHRRSRCPGGATTVSPPHPRRDDADVARVSPFGAFRIRW